MATPAIERHGHSTHESRVLESTRDSLRRARARAVRYYQDKRMLETKVRDLERSRDLWRTKFHQLTQTTPTEPASVSPPQS